MLFPAKTQAPAYPGAGRRRNFFETLRFVLHGRITLPICVFLVLSGSQAFAETRRPAAPGSEVVVVQVPEPSPPCRGKVALPDPMPCRGDVAAPEPPPSSRFHPAVEPPPCKGEVSLPDPPPCAGAPRPYPEPPRPEPISTVSIRELTARPRDHAGLRVQVSGILGRMADGSLFEEGYFLYNQRPVSSTGEFFGCPLVGRIAFPREGDRVTVTGRVVRRQEPSSSRRRGGTYYVLEVESLDPR